MSEKITVTEEVENIMNKMMQNYDSNPNESEYLEQLSKSYLYKNDDTYLTDCSSILAVCRS